MAHFLSMFDPKETLAAFDLKGRDVTLEIESVTAGEVIGEAARKSRKPIITFKGTTRKLIANKTNCKTIVTLYGSSETDDWVGKLVTLYPTTTPFGGEQKECLRIRPVVPKKTSAVPAEDVNP